MKYREANAVLSPCGLYRYVLTRGWRQCSAADDETVVFCMLNPSTADASEDDPTIRRCVGFARAWGYARLEVVNLFAFRATDPSELRKAVDPVGTENDQMILDVCKGRIVVCGWGATVSKWPRPAWAKRAAEVRKLVASVGHARHLGLTADGHPKHPLYLPAAAEVTEFELRL